MGVKGFDWGIEVVWHAGVVGLLLNKTNEKIIDNTNVDQELLAA
jgi:hypothetical protein